MWVFDTLEVVQGCLSIELKQKDEKQYLLCDGLNRVLDLPDFHMAGMDLSALVIPFIAIKLKDNRKLRCFWIYLSFEGCNPKFNSFEPQYLDQILQRYDLKSKLQCYYLVFR